MSRSHGLLHAYAALIKTITEAETATLFLPARSEEEAPVLVQQGDRPIEELESADAAARFQRDLEQTEPPKGGVAWRSSRTPNGWLVAVRNVPFWEASREPTPNRVYRRRAADARRGAPVTGAWIGLCFSEADRAETGRQRLIITGSKETTGTPLLNLGEVLASYTRQVSAILDDPVTGLPGRAEFHSRLLAGHEAAKMDGSPLALLLVNPDDFTTVNERFGHDAGDAILREMSARLQGVHRASDTLAKYGGAIFASFLVGADAGAASTVAEKVWRKLTETPYLAGRARVGISIGVVVIAPDDPTVGGALEIIRRADKALNAAKRTGGDRIEMWAPQLEGGDLGSLDRMAGVYTGIMTRDYRNMTLLSETMSVIAGSADFHDLVGRLADRLARTLKADRLGIFDWDSEERRRLVRAMGRGDDLDLRALSELELDSRSEGLIEGARCERRAMLTSDSPDDSEPLISFAVPLVLRDKCLGCLYLDGRKESLALEDASDLAFLEALGTQLALAFDRARLRDHDAERQSRERRRLKAEVSDLRAALQQAKLVYGSRAMEEVLTTVRRAAPTSATVLVTGESGTGKELIAKTLHEVSPFRDKPLVVVDCSSIPSTLIESELFGYERGAYTGAEQRKTGRLVEAEGGSIVLDEIGELPLEVQSKLLRFVQEKELLPVGGSRVRRVEARLIAVTNRDLAEEVSAGRFREDLFYRLNVVRIVIPPLRERPDDIVLLAQHFLERYSLQYQKGVLRFSAEAREALLQHAWPGNVRELQNRILQAVILCADPEIGLSELALDSGPTGSTGEFEIPVRTGSTTAGTRTRNGTRASVVSASGETHALASRSVSEAAARLRSALAAEIDGALRGNDAKRLPMGTWLAEDIVLEADSMTDGVLGRGRDLLGVPDTTYRRRVSKARGREGAGLVVRTATWERVRSEVAAFLRSPGESRGDRLREARDLLLEEVRARVPEDEDIGAALMGVTVPTFRRWIAEESTPMETSEELSV